MLGKCQLVMATGGTIVQDLTMQWSILRGFMQDLSFLVIDEGQQYGTDREIAVISLLKQQPGPVDWRLDKHQGESPRRLPMPKGPASSCWPRNTDCAATGTTTCHPTCRGNDQAPRQLLQ